MSSSMQSRSGSRDVYGRSTNERRTTRGPCRRKTIALRFEIAMRLCNGDKAPVHLDKGIVSNRDGASRQRRKATRRAVVMTRQRSIGGLLRVRSDPAEHREGIGRRWLKQMSPGRQNGLQDQRLCKHKPDQHQLPFAETEHGVVMPQRECLRYSLSNRESIWIKK